jgi:hypothetical protein
MISEPFAIGDTLIYRLDPRIRVGLTVLYSFVVALAYQFSVLTGYLAGKHQRSSQENGDCQCADLAFMAGIAAYL